MLHLCSGASVKFINTRIVNLAFDDLDPRPRRNITKPGPPRETGQLTVMVVSGTGDMVRFIDPIFRNVQFPMIQASLSVVLFDGGLLQSNSAGIQAGGLLVFNRTQFIANSGMMFAGAVTVMLGRALFYQCLFEANRAPTMLESTDNAVAWARSGLGGAVLAYEMGRMDFRTTIIFDGCTFTNNTAYEGGAIAAVGANANITNCTFSDNFALKVGMNVYASMGATLSISNSNIDVTDNTVVWERTNASQCFVGEFFSAQQGACLGCLPSTFSLVTPADMCLPCPANAQVSCHCSCMCAVVAFQVVYACTQGMLPCRSGQRTESGSTVLTPRIGVCRQAQGRATQHEAARRISQHIARLLTEQSCPCQLALRMRSQVGAQFQQCLYQLICCCCCCHCCYCCSVQEGLLSAPTGASGGPATSQRRSSAAPGHLCAYKGAAVLRGSKALPVVHAARDTPWRLPSSAQNVHLEQELLACLQVLWLCCSWSQARPSN
jgi:hypothetical protein